MIKNASFLIQQTLMRNALEQNFEICFYFFIFVPRNGIPSLFCSAKWFRTNSESIFSIFVPRYGIPEHFSLPRNGSNGIPRVFCSVEQPEFSFGTNQLFRIFRLPRIFCVGNSQPCLRVFTAAELRAYAL